MSAITTFVLLKCLQSNGNKHILRAVFRGTDGSLGYHKGKTYQLILTHLSAIQQFTKNWEYEIEDANRRGGYCPYTNIFTFLANWRPL